MSIKAQIESLTSQVQNLDTTTTENPTPNAAQSIYLYIAVISLVILLMLVWTKPSFITYKDENDVILINKTRLIGTTAVLAAVIIGGGYWYLNKK